MFNNSNINYDYYHILQNQILTVIGKHSSDGLALVLSNIWEVFRKARVKLHCCL